MPQLKKLIHLEGDKNDEEEGLMVPSNRPFRVVNGVY